MRLTLPRLRTTTTRPSDTNVRAWPVGWAGLSVSTCGRGRACAREPPENVLVKSIHRRRGHDRIFLTLVDVNVRIRIYPSPERRHRWPKV